MRYAHPVQAETHQLRHALRMSDFTLDELVALREVLRGLLKRVKAPGARVLSPARNHPSPDC